MGSWRCDLNGGTELNSCRQCTDEEHAWGVAAVGGAYEDFPGVLHFLWCVKRHGQKNILVLAESAVAAATPQIYTT